MHKYPPLRLFQWKAVSGLQAAIKAFVCLRVEGERKYPQLFFEKLFEPGELDYRKGFSFGLAKTW